MQDTKSKYDDPKAWELVDELSESFQYFLLKASNKLAQEKGKCDYYDRTKYADGILPIDTYKKEVDEICNRKLSRDWVSLRADIKAYGLRNSTLSPQMHQKQFYVVSGETNGIELLHETTCPLKSQRKGLLNKLFRNILH